MEIKKTNASEIIVINQLISRSKSYWNYNSDYLKAAIPLIQITESWLQQHEGYTLSDNEEVIGFLGIEKFDNFWKLEHLWIDTVRIRQGYGRSAIEYLFSIAKEQNIKFINLFPDPPAEKFYLNLGAKLTGKKTPSRIPNGPIFHEMIFIL